MRFVYECEICGGSVSIFCGVNDVKPKSVACPACGKDDSCLRSYRIPRVARTGWPMESEALGVHPDQIEEYAKDAARKGVPTQFTEEGNPIFESRKHRYNYMKLYGYYDKDAGYGDRTRG